MGSFLFRMKTGLHGPLAHQIADSMMPPRAFTTGNAGGSMIAVPVQDAIAARTPGVCISVRHQQPEAELRTKSCRFHTSGAVGNCCKESPAPNRSFRMKDGLFDRGCLAQLVGPASRINTMGQIALLGGKGRLRGIYQIFRHIFSIIQYSPLKCIQIANRWTYSHRQNYGKKSYGNNNYGKITLLRVIPTMTFIHVLTGTSSGILPDISSDILFAFYLAYLLAYLLAFYLTYLLTFYLAFYLA